MVAFWKGFFLFFFLWTQAFPQPTQLENRSQEETILSEGKDPLLLEGGESVDRLYSAHLFKTIFLLLGFVCLLFLTMWALRRLSRGRVCTRGSLKSMKVLERQPLSPKSVLYLVEIEGKRIWLSESQSEIRVIVSRDQADQTQDL